MYLKMILSISQIYIAYGMKCTKYLSYCN